MKKRFCILACLVVCTLLPTACFAESEADQYLVAGPWEMTVTGFANVSYLSFNPDGTGFLAVPVGGADTPVWTYSFTWQTLPDGLDCYINIFFEGEYPGIDWGNLHVPHKFNTYYLLWNPTLMFLIDQSHSGTDDWGRSSEKSMTLTRVDVIPGMASVDGGYGAFGGGRAGSR